MAVGWFGVVWDLVFWVLVLWVFGWMGFVLLVFVWLFGMCGFCFDCGVGCFCFVLLVQFDCLGWVCLVVVGLLLTLLCVFVTEWLV